MSTLWQCDWCGAVWDSRDAVALLDIEFGGDIDRKLHACPEHLPDDWNPPPEGLPDVAPVVDAEAWAALMDETG